jgi:cobalamin biosynthesis protein CobD/CbiB
MGKSRENLKMEGIIVLLLALAIGLTMGEFPFPMHPVAWLGKVILQRGVGD